MATGNPQKIAIRVELSNISLVNVHQKHTDLHPTHQQTHLSLQIEDKHLPSTKNLPVSIAAVPSFFHF